LIPHRASNSGERTVTTEKTLNYVEALRTYMLRSYLFSASYQQQYLSTYTYLYQLVP
jgi:hypothetical protein